MNHKTLALGCCVLAVGLALNSVLGPLVTGLIDYRYTETFENQGVGLDAFALAFAVPLLLLATALALGRHAAAPFVAFGPALMAAYMLPQYVLGAHYDDIPGNNEDFFILHLSLFILSAAVGVVAWFSVDAAVMPALSRRAQTWTRILMFAVAGFLVLRYLPSLVDIWSDEPNAEYRADPIAFWLIAFMDLGIVLPAALAAGLTLGSGLEAARKLVYAVVGWFALVGPAVAAMGFAMAINDDPHASWTSTIVFALYGAAFACLAGYVFRPLFKDATPAQGRQLAASDAR